MMRKCVLQEAGHGQYRTMPLLFSQVPCQIHTHKAPPWVTQNIKLQLLLSQPSNSMVRHHSSLEVATITAGCMCTPYMIGQLQRILKQGRTDFQTAPMQACCRRGI